MVTGQEYAPVIEDRVEASDVQPLIVDDDSEIRGGWDLGVVISAAYESNIFLSSTDPESDMVFRAAPAMAYTQGDEKEGEGGFIKGAYRPTLVIYSSNGSENRVDHQALASAGWRGKVTSITYTGGLQKLGDATADTGRQTDRLEFDNEVRAGWVAREKVIVELAAGNDQVRYVDPVFFDTDRTYGEAALRFVYSPKTELGLIYQMGRYDVQGTGPQDTRQLTGRIQWQPREKIRIDIEAGGEYRKTDNGSSTNPVLVGRLGWQPRKETDLYISAYMREEASAFLAGQNYGVKGLTAGISQRIGSQWVAKLEGGLEENDYEVVSGNETGAAGRNDRLWFLQPTLIRKLGNDSELSIFYRISDNDSSESAFGYDQRIIGIELNHKF